MKKAFFLTLKYFVQAKKDNKFFLDTCVSQFFKPCLKKNNLFSFPPKGLDRMKLTKPVLLNQLKITQTIEAIQIHFFFLSTICVFMRD